MFQTFRGIFIHIFFSWFGVVLESKGKCGKTTPRSLGLSLFDVKEKKLMNTSLGYRNLKRRKLLNFIIICLTRAKKLEMA